MVRQANENDIFSVEGILSDVVLWMDANGLHQWEKADVTWENLKKHYSICDFYIAFDENIPVACMILIDYDPVFWPNIHKGESLFLHKVAVCRNYAGKGFSKKLIDYAKERANQLKIKSLRLDCHQQRYKVRKVYEDQGFICVDERTLFDKYETAFYVCELND